jgi:siroheme synthase
MAEGLPADLPCAVVSRAAQPDQEVVYTTLGALRLGALGHADAAAQAPSLLLAGWAVRPVSQEETHARRNDTKVTTPALRS